MNVFTVLPLLLLLLGAASFAAHRAVWWLVTRLSYRAQREQFFTGAGYKRWARVVGLACLLYGLNVPDVLVQAGTGP